MKGKGSKKPLGKPSRDVQRVFPSLKPHLSDQIIDPSKFVEEAANMRRPTLAPLGDSIEQENRRVASDLTELFLWETRGSEEWTSLRKIQATEAFFQRAVHLGFVAALQRFRTEIATSPKGAKVLQSLRNNSAKGAAARRKQAEPRRLQARRLDRELRKQGGLMKKKTFRVQRIAEHLKVDPRTVERYLSRQK
jgi:hypothetical protein